VIPASADEPEYVIDVAHNPAGAVGAALHPLGFAIPRRVPLISYFWRDASEKAIGRDARKILFPRRRSV
jgi:hypothetical protein